MDATRHRHAAGTATRPADTPVTETRIAEAPVFVDSTGRRRRLVRRVAVGLLIGACAYGVLVVVSILGGPVPPNAFLPLPGGQHGPISAGKATATPRSTATTSVTATHTGTGAAPGAGTTAPAGRTATSPAAAPAASLSPSPSPSRHQPPGLVGKSASPGATGHGH